MIQREENELQIWNQAYLQILYVQVPSSLSRSGLLLHDHWQYETKNYKETLSA